jgi:acyl dehydratase
VIVAAVIPTVTVTDWLVVPLICTAELEKLQVGAEVTVGVIAQLRFAAPVKPPDGVSTNVNIAL